MGWFNVQARRALCGLLWLGWTLLPAQAQVHLAGGAAPADSQGRADLGGGGIPRIAGPVRALVVAAAAAHQLGDGGDALGRGPRLRPGQVFDRGHKGRIARRPKLTVEHVFEYTDPADNNRCHLAGHR